MTDGRMLVALQHDSLTSSQLKKTYGDEHAAIFLNRSAASEEGHDKDNSTDDDDKNGFRERSSNKCLNNSASYDQQ